MDIWLKEMVQQLSQAIRNANSELSSWNSGSPDHTNINWQVVRLDFEKINKK